MYGWGLTRSWVGQDKKLAAKVTTSAVRAAEFRAISAEPQHDHFIHVYADKVDQVPMSRQLPHGLLLTF
ncbi:hypothetical protein C1H46_040653 [Malus baccata]|uniref:Uncharacterized protein n=1 Tax=Malus baccata TaxID=106549 RepID=A0A540KHW4_MALBA|nr:hypothetical protein C1H46_040653 [Malus baccata]